MKLNGKTFLIDPVIESYAAPLPFFNRAFKGTTVFSAKDLPYADYLILTHDHWDHLEYPTMREMLVKTGKVICPLGLGSHLRAWGFPESMIEERDWQDTVNLAQGLDLHLVPARHFSGRLLERDKTLWTGYALITPDYKIFLSGDSGYGPHFAEAGRKFGPFDLAILENGQYDKRWPYIHMFPEETAQAAEDLGAKTLLPEHNGRFAMSSHAWDEPVKRLSEASKGKAYQLKLPLIGEVILLRKHL